MTDFEAGRQLLVDILLRTAWPYVMCGLSMAIGLAVGLRRGGWL